MTVKRVSFLLLVGVVALGGCFSHDTDGEAVTPTVVAGLRFVNVVPDTGGLSIRVVDVVGDAPNTINATFRTGGAPYGISIVGLPFHTAVAAGTRRIRAFLTSSDPAVASVIMLDEEFTFQPNVNYTIYFYGYSRTGGTPALAAMQVADDAADPGAANFGIRAIHLAPTLAPTVTGTAVDVFVDQLAAATAPAGAATFTNVNLGEVRPYVNLPVGTATANYRVAVAATGTTTPFFQVNAPDGATGTSTTEATAGERVGGTAMSVIIVPPSVAGSPATSFTTPSLIYAVDRKPPRTAL
jgi:hypothetical protein